MRILIPLYVILAVSWSSADKPEDCQILQTTDPRTPCYILIRDNNIDVPSFVYMLNLPRPTSDVPCPVSQSLDPTYNCYLPPTMSNYPAYMLNVPLPAKADDIDESPAGKERLRENKANPIFRKTGEIPSLRGVFSSAKLGPSSPLVTMAYFKPLNPSNDQLSSRTVFRTDQTSSALNTLAYRQPQYHITRYQTSVDQPSHTTFTHSTQRGSFPYPSSSGGSISVFQAPYPPAL